MVHGHFNLDTGRPLFTANIEIPRLGCQSSINFLLDTGSDTTLLLPKGGSKLGVNYAQLDRVSQGTVIGGVADGFVETAWITFTGEDTFYAYVIDMLILPPPYEQLDESALLGRNIIDRWRITYEKPSSLLEADVITADRYVR